MKSPRHPGHYSDRALECHLALEPLFLDLVAGENWHLLDISCILIPLMAEAFMVGWTVDDVALAIEELAADYERRVAPNPAAGPRPLDMLGHPTLH